MSVDFRKFIKSENVQDIYLFDFNFSKKGLTIFKTNKALADADIWKSRGNKTLILLSSLPEVEKSKLRVVMALREIYLFEIRAWWSLRTADNGAGKQI